MTSRDICAKLQKLQETAEGGSRLEVMGRRFVANDIFEYTLGYRKMRWVGHVQRDSGIMRVYLILFDSR